MAGHPPRAQTSTNIPSCQVPYVQVWLALQRASHASAVSVFGQVRPGLLYTSDMPGIKAEHVPAGTGGLGGGGGPGGLGLGLGGAGPVHELVAGSTPRPRAKKKKAKGA